MKNLNFVKPALLAMFFVLNACSEDFLPKPDTREDLITLSAQSRAALEAEYTYDHNAGVWLKEINDPYALDNFKKAYSNVLNDKSIRNSVSHLDLNNFEIEATHYHVRIKPTTPMELIRSCKYEAK